MVTSFLSEHTAEYSLVYILNGILTNDWRVTPLFYWHTREGSRIARLCSEAETPVKVMAMYARRPKLCSPTADCFLMKVNSSILRRAGFLIAAGIPVLCGVPRISRLLDFHLDCDCVWLSIKEVGQLRDIEIELELASGMLARGILPQGIELVRDNDVKDLALHSAQDMTLGAAMAAISESARVEDFTHPLFGAQYKPVYLILQRGTT